MKMIRLYIEGYETTKWDGRTFDDAWDALVDQVNAYGYDTWSQVFDLCNTLVVQEFEMVPIPNIHVEGLLRAWSDELYEEYGEDTVGAYEVSEECEEALQTALNEAIEAWASKYDVRSWTPNGEPLRTLRFDLVQRQDPDGPLLDLNPDLKSFLQMTGALRMSF